ncbi:DUF4435 domain-containing protein [Saccharopolyspora shandongensis]|uniref:DUF4435 domain-containing protein n=1 Tax=Saccharopolyspora shandongensis TaxID=418495 RepID=UPI0034043F7A
MRDLVTDDEVFVQAQMLRGAGPFTVIIVEGDSDSRTLDDHISHQSARLVPSKSKTAAIKAARLAERHGVDRIIALLDADFDSRLGTVEVNDLVAYTENYDLEADVFFLPRVAEKLVSAFVDEEVLSRVFAKPYKESAVASIIRAAGIVGKIRLSSVVDELGLSLRGLPFGSFISRSGDFDVDKLARIILSRSPNAQIELDQISLLVTELIETYNEDQSLCCGHDLACAMSALFGAWGSRMSSEFAENCIRLALSDGELPKLKIYHKINSIASRWNGLIWRIDLLSE